MGPVRAWRTRCRGRHESPGERTERRVGSERRRAGERASRASSRSPGSGDHPQVEGRELAVGIAACSSSARVFAARFRPSGPVAPSTMARPTLASSRSRSSARARSNTRLGGVEVAAAQGDGAELHPTRRIVAADRELLQALGLGGEGRQVGHLLRERPVEVQAKRGQPRGGDRLGGCADRLVVERLRDAQGRDRRAQPRPRARSRAACGRGTVATARASRPGRRVTRRAAIRSRPSPPW